MFNNSDNSYPKEIQMLNNGNKRTYYSLSLIAIGALIFFLSAFGTYKTILPGSYPLEIGKEEGVALKKTRVEHIHITSDVTPKKYTLFPASLPVQSQIQIIEEKPRSNQPPPQEKDKDSVEKNVVSKTSPTSKERIVKKEALLCIDQGDKLMQEQKYNEALDQYKKAITIDRNYPVPYSRMSVVYFKKRNLSEALSYTNKALDLEPEYYDARFNRGVICLFDQKYDLALADLKILHEKFPNNPRVQEYYPIALKAKEGPKWNKTYIKSTAHYDVKSNLSQAKVNEVAYYLELIYKEYETQFQVAKRQKTNYRFNVLIFDSQESFIKYTSEITHGATVKNPGGLYHSLLSQLLLWDNQNLYNTLYHEAFHQFLDYFLPNPPLWFNEGLAQFFETAELTGQRFILGKISHIKLGIVKSLIMKKQALSLTDIRKLNDNKFRELSGVVYPLSWSWIYFFIKSDKYRPLLNRYFIALLDGDKNDDAWQKGFGNIKEEELEKDWRTYIIGLK